MATIAAPADPQDAFRAGLAGQRWQGSAAGGDGAAGPAVTAVGANMAAMMEAGRMPGLGEPRAAFETGRVLRRIAWLLDRTGAPAAVGRQFRDNVAGAVMTHHMRKRARPWGAEDTVAMFMELYGRILGTEGDEFAHIRDSLLAYARGEQGRRTAPPAAGDEPPAGRAPRP